MVATIDAEELSNDIQTIFEDLPCAVLVLSDDLRLRDFNRSAFRLLHRGIDELLNFLAGDALGCVHASRSPDGCGTTPACRECVLRNTVEETARTGERLSAFAPMTLLSNDSIANVRFLVATSRVKTREGSLVLLTLQDLSQVRACADQFSGDHC